MSSVGVSVLEDWDIQPQVGEEHALSIRKSWFRVRHATAGIIFCLSQ